MLVCGVLIRCVMDGGWSRGMCCQLCWFSRSLWRLGFKWEFCGFVVGQVGGEDPKARLEKIKRQLSAGAGTVLLQGPLLKRSETVS